MIAHRNRTTLSCALAVILSTGWLAQTVHGQESFAGRPEPTALFIVVGAAGEEQYEDIFQSSASRWKTSGTIAGANVTMFNGSEDETSDRERLQAELFEASNGSSDLWLVFIGHGTYASGAAKFNLHGPDVSAAELSNWLKPLKRRIVVLQGSSSSAPFINQLSDDNRIIITATRSGAEQNYARFSRFAAEALVSPEADIDQDDQNSALEIFLAAARMTEEWYKNEGRLATEHPLIDDNGDGRGTPADWFNGLTVQNRAADGALPDGLRANQVHLVRSEFESILTDEEREWRDAKEVELARLRERKRELIEADYLEQLEVILLELARFYSEVESRMDTGASDRDS